MRPFTDLSGKRFYMLRVVSLAHKDGRFRPYYHCVCDCGNKVVVRADSFTTGNTKSCGCLNDALSMKRFMKVITKHGDAKTRLYRIWTNMRDRCAPQSREKRRGRHYAALGVTVCEEWQEYSRFREWALSNGYSDALQIDRINPAQGYEPANCRWVTPAMQQRNKRRSLYVEYMGQRKHLKEWAEAIGVKYHTLYARLQISSEPHYILRSYRHGNKVC